ncbi:MULTISPECIES: TetR/AcrR family transcriptional regulator [Alphaproteobacteria]|nr:MULTISPECIES: TetR/AcrR family transcriptional regulator [Alphaproteobacteria]
MEAAVELIAQGGVSALKMTDLAARAGVPIGSLYQFFAERAAVVRALHDRHTERVESGARRVFSTVTTLAEAEALMGDAVDTFFTTFRDDPVYLPVWLAALSDPDLQRLNTDHQARLTGMLCDIFRPLLPEDSKVDLETRVMLFVYLTGAVVRRAMIEDDQKARCILDEWKRSIRGTMFTA